MPKLPNDGVFSVNCLLCKGQQHTLDTVVWQWRDDRGVWHPYTLMDIKIVEASYQSGEEDVNISTQGKTYTIDFNAMQQTNEETGNSRPIQRKANPFIMPTRGESKLCDI